jgi:hypothetical protein
MTGPRDYGLPNSEPTSRPIASPLPTITPIDACPLCRCKEVMVITLEVNQPLLKGGKGKGSYFGCPACPWASPMLITATKEEE